MNTFDKFWRTIPNRNGVILFLAMTAFFLLMRVIGLAHIYWLRSLNFIFVIILTYNSIVAYRKKSGASYYEDFADFFRIGFRTNIIGIGLFSIFMALYLDQFDHAFMNDLAQYENFGGLISPVIAAIVVFVEGMISALACAFIIAQYLKSKTVEGEITNKANLHKEARKS